MPRVFLKPSSIIASEVGVVFVHKFVSSDRLVGEIGVEQKLVRVTVTFRRQTKRGPQVRDPEIRVLGLVKLHVEFIKFTYKNEDTRSGPNCLADEMQEDMNERLKMENVQKNCQI